MEKQTNLPKITNALEAESWTRNACEKHFNMLDFGMKIIVAKNEGRLEAELSDQEKLNVIYKAEKSQWKRDYFRKNFPQLINCHIGKVLLGLVKEDISAYRHKASAF